MRSPVLWCQPDEPARAECPAAAVRFAAERAYPYMLWSFLEAEGYRTGRIHRENIGPFDSGATLEHFNLDGLPGCEAVLWAYMRVGSSSTGRGIVAGGQTVFTVPAEGGYMQQSGGLTIPSSGDLQITFPRPVTVLSAVLYRLE